jgi:hypothetical protein
MKELKVEIAEDTTEFYEGTMNSTEIQNEIDRNSLLKLDGTAPTINEVFDIASGKIDDIQVTTAQSREYNKLHSDVDVRPSLLYLDFIQEDLRDIAYDNGICDTDCHNSDADFSVEEE